MFWLLLFFWLVASSSWSLAFALRLSTSPAFALCRRKLSLSELHAVVKPSTAKTADHHSHLDPIALNPCRIKVIGVGGGGGNAVNRMTSTSAVSSRLPLTSSLPISVASTSLATSGIEFWAVNTDLQALGRSTASNKLSIGAMTSRGLGAGGSPEIGRLAGLESHSEIEAMVRDADLVFVTAGMGGGTGSGAAPIVAQCARDAGALTVGVVTKPFAFEGNKRMQQAKDAILRLKDSVDTLIVVSNDKLLQIVPAGTPLTDSFLIADDILRQAVVGISDLITKPGLVNVDFADIRSVMSNAGTALLGVGRGRGANRGIDAAKAAISSPLLDWPIDKASGIVFNVVGGSDVTLQEVQAAAQVIYNSVDVDANIIFGANIDSPGNNNNNNNNGVNSGEITITVLATGFGTDFHPLRKNNNNNNNNNVVKGTQSPIISSSATATTTATRPIRQQLFPVENNNNNRDMRQPQQAVVPTTWQQQQQQQQQQPLLRNQALVDDFDFPVTRPNNNNNNNFIPSNNIHNNNNNNKGSIRDQIEQVESERRQQQQQQQQGDL